MFESPRVPLVSAPNTPELQAHGELEVGADRAISTARHSIICPQSQGEGVVGRGGVRALALARKCAQGSGHIMLVSDQRRLTGLCTRIYDCSVVVLIAVLIGHTPPLPCLPALPSPSPCPVSLETYDPATGQTVNTSQLLTRAQFDLLLSQAINVSTLVTQAQFDAQTADQREEDFLITNQVWQKSVVGNITCWARLCKC